MSKLNLGCDSVTISKGLVELVGDFNKAFLLKELYLMVEQNKRSLVYVYSVLDKEEHYTSTDTHTDMKEYLKSVSADGWLRISTEDIANNTILGVSPATVRRYMDELVAEGFVYVRDYTGSNPYVRTKEYCVALQGGVLIG